jgi:hypothetical protein
MSTAFGSDHDGPHRALRRDSTTLLLVIAAFAWGMLLILGAVTVPIITASVPPVTASAPPTHGASATPSVRPNGQQLFESPRVSVLSHDGAAGVVVAGIPAAISLLVGGLLWAETRRRRRVFLSIAAWALSAALVAAGIVGFLTFLVGIVAVPTGVLLILACSRAAPWRSRAVPAVSARS